MLVSPGWQNKPGIFLTADGAFPALDEPKGGNLLDVVPTILGAYGFEDPALPGRRLSILRERDYAPAPAAPVSAPAPPDDDLMRIAAENGAQPLPAVPPGWHAKGLAELALMLQDRAPETAAEISAGALRLDPDNVTALAVRAMTQVTLERPDELPKLAEALDRVAPSRRWGALARGCYHLLKGEMTKAGSFLTEAESDRDAETLLRVAAMWLVAERPMNAERVFKSILSRDPQDAAAEIGLSMTALARIDYRAAEAALQRARAIDPGRAPIYLQLALVYKQTGRPLEAQNAIAFARRLGASVT
jgi:tetratricopeptide (TPR) repeat protein